MRNLEVNIIPCIAKINEMYEIKKQAYLILNKSACIQNNSIRF